MPKAERGTPKDLSNRMKSRGLQKLAFYCQVCEKQMRDQNGFRQHCASEPHVRMMLLVGERPARAIHDFSARFRQDFLQLLRTAHGEKRVSANRFYQEYIQDKSHVHMNATHWKTLSQFCKSLGREGTCRVEESEADGLTIAWIDSSPEALSRQEAIKRKKKLERSDEERANLLLERQIERAQQQQQAQEQGQAQENKSNEIGHAALQQATADSMPHGGEKIKISFGNGIGGSSSETVHGDRATTAPKKNIFSALAKPAAASASASSSSSTGRTTTGRKDGNFFSKKPLSNAQQMIRDQQLRAARRQAT